MNSLKLKNEYRDILTKYSFDYAGVFDFSYLYNQTPSPLEPDIEFYKSWISKNWNADMRFMENNFAARTDARHILAGVKSAIVVLVPYSVGERVRGSTAQPGKTDALNPLVEKIARYARGKDYHRVIKSLGDKTICELKQKLDIPFDARIIVDSAPFFERAHAAQSGIGFIGKNTMLIRPGIGSFFFIATFLTTLSVSELCEESEKNPILSLSCGDCRRCIDACPTQAISPYSVDAHKCLSYLSIENRDTVPTEYIPHFKDIFFGCDICQTACPYNFSTLDVRRVKEFSEIHTHLKTLTTKQIANLELQEYELWFGGTSLTRAKYAGLVRNALYTLHANESDELALILEKRKNDEDELIQKTVRQLISLRA